jgi:ubiquinone/menaquinone biosynthesis C-methylase UbiE
MDYDKEQKEIQMIERYLDCQDQDTLEVGCGEGHVSALLSPKARKYIAIDPDQNRLKKARFAHPVVDFRIGNGEALTFAEGSFSRILFTLSLHHQKSHVALKEAYRVLTEDGRVVIVEPSADGEFQQFFHLFDDETEALAKAFNAIKQSDFELESHETFCTAVTFIDNEELCNYPFDRSIRQPDDRIRIFDTLHRLCGSFDEGQPIYLQEKLHIFLLQKRFLS